MDVHEEREGGECQKGQKVALKKKTMAESTRASFESRVTASA
jgi:hypothetical protein